MQRCSDHLIAAGRYLNGETAMMLDIGWKEELSVKCPIYDDDMDCFTDAIKL